MSTAGPFPPVGDPAAGLAPERTVLAWQRTALALVVNALLLLARGPLGGRAGVALAGCALLLAGAVGVVGRARRRDLGQPAVLAAGAGLPRPLPVALGLGVAALALGAAALVVGDLA